MKGVTGYRQTAAAAKGPIPTSRKAWNPRMVQTRRQG